MQDTNNIQRPPRHARLFELIRQGHLSNQIAETRHYAENSISGEKQFLQRASNSLSSKSSNAL